MSVEGIILAAGLSSRSEVYKLSLKVRDKTIIQSCVESMYDVCSRIIVVGGYNFEVVASMLSIYMKVDMIYNRNYSEGMFSSVKEGLKQIRTDKFFLTPGDYPLIRNETYKKMLKIDNDIVIPRFNGIKGHPVLIKSNLISEIIDNPHYINLKQFISEHSCSVVEVLDEGILLDIDNLQDYNNIIYKL